MSYIDYWLNSLGAGQTIEAHCTVTKDAFQHEIVLSKNDKNKFEMFQTIASFIHLMNIVLLIDSSIRWACTMDHIHIRNNECNNNRY